MRFVYLKEANAVREAERVLDAPELLKVGGADLFLAHFLEVASENPKLVLSLHQTAPEHDEEFGVGGLEIKSYFWFSPWLVKCGHVFRKPLFTLARRSWVATCIFIRVMSFRPNRVLCWSWAFPLWGCYLAARLNGARFAISRHNRFPLPDEPWFRRLTAWVDKRIMRRADAILVHGPYLLQETKAAGVHPDRIIEFDCTYPPGSIWNRRAVEETDNAGGCTNDGVQEILFLGRVEAAKGAFDLLEACVPLLRRQPLLKLVYAGSGEATGELRAAVARHKLERQVVLLGPVPHEQLPARIREAGVVVTPTRRKFPEGRCMATMEGLVAGRPVIAPGCGPFPYLVQHGKNGLLYEPDSVVSLRESLARVVEDGDLYSALLSGARDSSTELRAHEFAYYDAVKEAFER
jgi:glycosyltransferase involved in cell wall biosynthesis